jgi:hypothetical protein
VDGASPPNSVALLLAPSTRFSGTDSFSANRREPCANPTRSACRFIKFLPLQKERAGAETRSLSLSADLTTDRTRLVRPRRNCAHANSTAANCIDSSRDSGAGHNAVDRASGGGSSDGAARVCDAGCSSAGSCVAPGQVQDARPTRTVTQMLPGGREREG